MIMVMISSLVQPLSSQISVGNVKMICELHLENKYRAISARHQNRKNL